MRFATFGFMGDVFARHNWFGIHPTIAERRRKLDEYDAITTRTKT